MKAQYILGILLLFVSSNSILAAKPDPHHYAKWLGPETCAECHEDEASIWRHAHHATSFKAMPRSKEGKQIAKALSISRIKMSKECGSCHMSYVLKGDSPRLHAVAGVSCENCHGPAKDWNTVHQDYGGKDVTAKQETSAHKKERWAKSEASGMVRPRHRYKIFKQCYQCHTVPDESLINKTSHPVGDTFELVKWSNGEVRHNVWYSKGRVNNMRPVTMQRVRYVMGQGLALEFSLRGLAQATGPGKYVDQMQTRAKKAIANLEAINRKIKIVQVGEMLSLMKGQPLDYQQKDQLGKTADKISDLNQAFVDQHDGTTLAPIDNMLPKKYQGEPKK